MCDYSLHGIENRLAVEGEVLEVYRFHTGSKGLTSPKYLKPGRLSKSFKAFLRTQPSPECAVCIPDGAKLSMTGISAALQSSYGISATEVVTFRQITADEAAHRDAVEFRNGVKISLQKFDEGQRIEVLELSSEGTTVREENLNTFHREQARLDVG